MTREEKAYSLGQEYFPDESNIWARPNYEAQWVSEACIKMAEWERERLINMAREWLKKNMYIENVFAYSNDNEYIQYVCASACDSVDEFVDNFCKALEE